MKSPPKKTAFTPSILNKSLARGLPFAAAMDGTSNVPPPSNTVRPGKNFSEAGFGVSWVWINRLRFGVCKDTCAHGRGEGGKKIHRSCSCSSSAKPYLVPAQGPDQPSLVPTQGPESHKGQALPSARQRGHPLL